MYEKCDINKVALPRKGVEKEISGTGIWVEELVI